MTTMRLLRWTKRLGFGACAAGTAPARLRDASLGSVRALTEKELRSVFFKNAVALLVTSLVLVTLVSLVILPFEWLAALFLSAHAIDTSLRAFRHSLWSMVPFVLVTACRYCNVDMFENAFFAGLATRDPALAVQIRKKKAIYWDWEYIRHSLVAIARQLSFGLLALVISPLFGVIVPLFRFGYRIRRMESVFWIPVFVAFCFPATRISALQIVHLWMDARAVIRELYDPIVARLKSAHSEAAVHLLQNEVGDEIETENAEPTKKKSQGVWHRGRSDAARLGFALVFGYMLQIPFIGPLTWFVGFVAAGLFAPELIELHVFTLTQGKEL